MELKELRKLNKGYIPTLNLRFKKGKLEQIYYSIYVGNKDVWVEVEGQRV